MAHHDTAHTPQDHPDTVDSSHHVDSPVDHHDEASHIFAPQPPAVATPSITDPASTGSGDPFQPGILLAVNAKPSDLEAAWAMGLSVDQVVSLDHLGIVITRFRLPRGARTLNSLRNLIKRKSDLPYDLNHYYRIASSSPADDARSYPRRLIGWSLPANGSVPAARIGMVDTFINPRITALKRQKITTRSFVAGKKKTSGTHGTRIASILVGAPDSDFPGLMPQARIYAADAFSIGRSGRYHASALAIARALNWLAAQKVDVINLSLAGPDNRLLKLAVARTLASPIPIVAAAGNQGPTAAPAFPAAYEKVIAVTAVDRFNRIYRQANQGVYIDFAAPGIRIWLPGKTGKGRYCTGTSYASAYGTAMAATVWTRPDTDKRIDTLVRLLRKNALDLGPPGRDPVFGWGLIHCGTATTR
ncbi:MAG: peptidase S8/S53 subtilisin kexin sedolisin [Deltaproteobacteria bacterium]|nr:MAG: peptidase S8/S53 subtilisin kexin sedolisin [Deltaproteobacteria bacterium]